MLDIRSLANDELDALLSLLRELHPADAPTDPERACEVWRRMLVQPGLHCLGAFVNGRLAGSCTSLVVPNLTRNCRPWAIVENVVTAMPHRRQGIGRALLDRARSLACEAGCYKLMLQTSRLDPQTFNFYEASGFDRHAKQAFLLKL